ncbi:hypothetical protein [Natrinema halophilum]|uniref:Uncharacterized protein n=1 Tax=Natrinema halophilum TaxID=1699371 RepID=A0A7D5GRT6_9EURY|nr:hypothetical protein [Natrinema halophilum]QLG48749.1 hypothetical protein HYG82_07765 [Natrinema halophilum]
MTELYDELGFDTLLALAAGLALVAYMLGIFPGPDYAAAVGLGFVVAGVIIFVPSGARVPAFAIGVVSVGVAGIAFPRAVVAFVDTPARNELPIVLTGSGLVLVLAFGLVRLTAFDTRRRQTVE